MLQLLFSDVQTSKESYDIHSIPLSSPAISYKLRLLPEESLLCKLYFFFNKPNA